METKLQGRVALVAASTSGLGLAVAQSLAAEGARVVISGRRGEVATAIASQLPSAIGIAVDLSQPSSAAKLYQATIDGLGSVDVLVLNSGGPGPGSATSVTRQNFIDAVESMVLQQMELVSLVLPGMIDRGWGRIVAIGSGGIQQPNPELALSSIARASLAAYLKTLSQEVARQGVTVNMVLPGRIDTDRVRFLDKARAQRENISAEQVSQRSQASIPLGRYGRPDEFAALVTFLCSAAASYITGEQIRCDGGLAKSY